MFFRNIKLCIKFKEKYINYEILAKIGYGYFWRLFFCFGMTFFQIKSILKGML